MSKQRNTKDFTIIFCPFCTLPAAQADGESQSGFSRANKRGMVSKKGNTFRIRCGECGREWVCAQLRFRGWKPGQELGASGPVAQRQEGLQPTQIACRDAVTEGEEDDGTGDALRA